jgi:translation initiation factor IF-1
MNEQNLIHVEGLVTESLPNHMFCVLTYNGCQILSPISGRIRRNSVKILPGDRVKVKLVAYDLTKERVIYRLSNKSANN